MKAVPDFTHTHVMIIGDVMLDRYWSGNASRISPEAPVPVVHVKDEEARPGGAANVALNISALGGKTTLLGMNGQDEPGEALTQHLIQNGVECRFQTINDLPTVTKLRVLSHHQQLIRLDFEAGFHETDSTPLQNLMEAAVASADIVVLSDYAKGTLADPQPFIHLACQTGKPVLVDPKGNSFEKYRGATLIKPNMSEFETIVGACPDLDTLVEKGENLRRLLELEALLITRSEHGMTLLQGNEAPLHLPAYAREVYDVTGAGDTVIGVLSAGLSAGLALADATRLANLAAGLAVTRLGTVSITASELSQELHDKQNGILSENDLETAIKAAQAAGEKVVMTNGCFDILHAGHAHYLNQARQLGDRLVVAVNDDASVGRLKGDTRPIVQLEQRMAMLESLGSVDWVVPFSEDTPQRLICRLLPDILVKGGDYQVEEIAGHECVLENGGQVLTLDFLPGHSTTDIIKKIQAEKT